VRAVLEKAQPPQGYFRGEFAGDHASLDEHWDRREAEPNGGDTAWCRGIGLITDETVSGICLVKVILEGGDLKSIQILLGRRPIHLRLILRPVQILVSRHRAPVSPQNSFQAENARGVSLRANSSVVQSHESRIHGGPPNAG